MENTTIEDLQRRCDELEDLVNGLCAYLAIQSKSNGWKDVDVDDESVKELLRPMLRRERRLQKSGVMAGEGFYAGQALVRIQQVKHKLP